MCERPQYLTESKGGQGFLELLSLMRNGSEMVPAGKPRSEGATQQSNAAIEPNFPRLIVFFDGECVLCNVYADLLMGQLNRRNRTPAADLSVALAPLQGKTARKLLPPHLQIPPYPSLISCQLAPGPSQTLTQPVQELNVRSEAILCILPYLGRGWRRFARIIHFVPRGIRDTIYDWVARNRYVLFGRRSTCRLPTQEEKKWILD
jgi:predicted DCC family thiol-disulfide oxidoreductase YuxK